MTQLWQKTLYLYYSLQVQCITGRGHAISVTGAQDSISVTGAQCL